MYGVSIEIDNKYGQNFAPNTVVALTSVACTKPLPTCAAGAGGLDDAAAAGAGGRGPRRQAREVAGAARYPAGSNCSASVAQ